MTYDQSLLLQFVLVIGIPALCALGVYHIRKQMYELVGDLRDIDWSEFEAEYGEAEHKQKSVYDEIPEWIDDGDSDDVR